MRANLSLAAFAFVAMTICSHKSQERSMIGGGTIVGAMRSARVRDGCRGVETRTRPDQVHRQSRHGRDACRGRSAHTEKRLQKVLCQSVSQSVSLS